ncbi:lipopolysaccharide biosynthesis protein [Leuconostoc pseudomesenteroides]|uniref:lipopolysaccharide biosynthesis protein n=1 Tax=Leuconostoc pseudomesenteroides TaxID=33968 RepID=UPI001669C074|nr:transporter [Leuconostoc pseudomesenteroides]MCT4412664.1 transporter [Leuconostoc pseudomesenteroides]
MNKLSRTKSATINSAVASSAQFIQLLMQFISRSVFINVLGAEFLGLNGLFLNLLGYLNFAELGLGAAITFSLYEPLANEDKAQVAAIMTLFKKWYRYIALFVLAGGLILTPSVPNLINGGVAHLNVNVYIAFLLALSNTVLSYLLTYKRTLLLADQKGYVNTLNTVGYNIVGQIVQIVTLYMFKDFYLFLSIQAVTMLLSNLHISRVVDKLYPYVYEYRQEKVSSKLINYMKKNISGMLSAKMGGIIVNGTDNLLLSYYIGLASVAMYANYTMIIMGLTQVMGQLISAVTSSIGNLGASKENQKKQEEVFYKYFYISSLLSIIVAVGFSAFSSTFVTLWLGKKMVYSFLPLLILSLNFVFQSLRQSVINYTNAYGLYWYARWKPIFESLVNLVVSWTLVKYTGLGISGVLIGTITSNLIVNVFWESWIVLHYGLKARIRRFLCLYMSYIFGSAMVIFVTVYSVENFSGEKFLNGILITILAELMVFIMFMVLNKLFYPKNLEGFNIGALLQSFKY